MEEDVNSHMVYHVLSPERAYTRSARFAGKGGYQRQMQQDYRHRDEVMTFSDAFEPAQAGQHEDQRPVYAPQRRNPWRKTSQRQTTQPVSNMDTGRVTVLNREGVSLSVAAVATMLALVLIGVVWLSYSIRVKAVNDQHNANMVETAALQRTAQDLESELGVIVSETQIAGAAVELGMERARSSDVIYVTIPDNVVCSLPTGVTGESGF